MLIPEKYQRDLLVYAFRYTLGRCTFAPHTVMEVLKGSWKDISQSDRDLYKREIVEAQKEDRLGMEMDKRAWLKILELE